MSVGASVTGQSREHKPKTVKEFCSCTEGAAYAGDTGSLMQCKSSRNIEDLIDIGLSRLRHSPSGVGGKRLEIASRAFRIQHSKCQRGFARARYSGDSDNLPQRDIYIYVLQVVHLGATHQYLVRINLVHRLPIVCDLKISEILSYVKDYSKLMGIAPRRKCRRSSEMLYRTLRS